MLTDRLINEMGLLKLQAKNKLTSNDNTAHVAKTTINDSAQTEKSEAQQEQPDPSNEMKEVKLDKNEFRLLVKMLQAIGHECVYDNIGYDNQIVTYKYKEKSLIFNNINHQDTDSLMNLSQLGDLITDTSLKRANWEKLKTL